MSDRRHGIEFVLDGLAVFEAAIIGNPIGARVNPSWASGMQEIHFVYTYIKTLSHIVALIKKIVVGWERFVWNVPGFFFFGALQTFIIIIIIITKILFWKLKILTETTECIWYLYAYE